eukprot:NODE_3_length_80033_cov_0.932970.p48 type:complete len:212 gc:universal NODE_3_length_80033_cov_0.932970:56984-56349(-)
MLFSKLGKIPFNTALKMQNTLKNNRTFCVLLCEHYPTFTLGRRQLLTNSEFLHLQSFCQVIKLQRGGQTTFHGPGQLVLYPILDLKALNLTIKEYINKLESVILSVLSKYNICAETNNNIGVYVEQKKIASIGVHVQRFITCHGAAINFSKEVLPWFEKIVPCGLKGMKMTSVETCLDEKLCFDTFVDDVCQEFCAQFKFEPQLIDPKKLL